ncbi:MAG TPA: BTAD domain-containing putative transcriptional regulator [Gaiellaceae bacterium]
MDVRLLGPFEVVVDGSPVAPSARRPRALLAALVLRAGSPVSVDALIEAVWDGDAPESAPSLLRLYVSQLRRLLSPGRLVTRAPGYLLELEDGECDAARFEQLLAEGRGALEGGNARLARSLYGRALDLWRGDALADFATSEFATDEASRLDDLRLACVEGRVEADLRLGRHDDVLEDLERLVAEHPLRERLRGQLMLALYRSGRQADALACYREGRAVLVDELGIEPTAELRELERRILDHDPSLDVQQETDEPFRVPPPQTATFGRASLLERFERELLDPGTRLVTLVGPGGIGKTRIAVELAHRLGGRLTDGAVLVHLAPLQDPSLLLPAIARALELRESGSASWPELVAHELRGRELLLVLDNFEHLVDGAAPVTGLIDAAPRLTVLATSRRPLRLAAERVVQVPPLEPDAARELLGARTVAASAAVDAESDEFRGVCERLEGLPLAIELAAPWFRTLPPGELLSLLDSRLDVLSGGPRDAPERHRTMRSAIDWSFGLLDPAEQRLLGRLSIFHGDFTTDAVLDVGGPDASAGRLDALVSASIVRSASGRHRLLEVVREYAEALPSADDEGRDAHALHFVRLAETAEAELAGAEQSVWLERLERDHANLRTALDWLVARGERGLELRLVAALGRFWYMRGYLSEGLERLQRAVGHAPPDDDATVAKALRSSSALALLRGDYPRARESAERALAMYRRLGDETGVVRSLSNLGAILPALGELDAAAATLDECVRAAESLGDERLIALACNNRGDVALLQGDLEMAAAQFERSLGLLRSIDDTANVARALYNLGAVAAEQRRDDEAVAMLQESLELSARVDDDEDVAWCLIALAAVAARRGDAVDAASMLGFTTALLERLGATTKTFEQRLFEQTRDRLRDALGAAELEVALAAGARLPRADAFGLGLAVGSPS